MTQRDRDRLVALKKAKKGLITQRQAAEEIGQSERHVRRLLDRLKGKGDSALVHALRGRRSNRKLDEKTKQKALEILRRDVYRGFGPTLAVGYQRACLARGARRKAVLDQHDRRCLQPAARTVRAARFDGRKHAAGMELCGTVWSAGELLHRQGGSVSNGAQKCALRHRSAAGRARALAADADRTSAPGVGHRVDRGALAAGQGPRGTQLPDSAGPSGQRPARGRRKDPGTGQRVSGDGVHRLVEQHDCRGSGQQRRCAPTLRQGSLAGCFVELRRTTAGQQWLYDSGRQPNLQDCTQRHSCGHARSRCTGRRPARRLYGSTFRQALPNGHGLLAASQNTQAQSRPAPCAQVCCTACEKPMDEELPPDQSGENGSVHDPNVAPGPRLKTNSVDREKAARPTSRFLYSKPPLGSLTKVSLPRKAKPPEGTPQGPVNRGFAAVYFGANSVASALNLPQERDLPKNHHHSKPPLSNPTPQPDISTWQRLGHFYLALTPREGAGQRARKAERPRGRHGRRSAEGELRA